LKKRVDVDFAPEDLLFVSGAFPGLFSTLKTIVNPGDEVIYLTPAWMFYNPMILACGAHPVPISIDMTSFDLDLNAIKNAITPKTRVIFINTPHNPTGKIYQPDTLERLAKILKDESEKNGHTIYLISDEAYSEIVFDNEKFHSPIKYYDNTFLVYTWTKVLLAPMQRIGFVAISPKMRDRTLVYQALFTNIYLIIFAAPPAAMMHSLAEICQKRIGVDIAAVQNKRDKLIKAMTDANYTVFKPQGTFYIWVKCPIEDETRFVRELLAKEDVFVLPGGDFETTTGSWFRISLTANNAMVDFALPIFSKVVSALPK